MFRVLRWGTLGYRIDYLELRQYASVMQSEPAMKNHLLFECLCNTMSSYISDDNV